MKIKTRAKVSIISLILIISLSLIIIFSSFKIINQIPDKTSLISDWKCSKLVNNNYMINFTVQNIGNVKLPLNDVNIYINDNKINNVINSDINANSQVRLGIITTSKTNILKVQTPANVQEIAINC